MVLNAEKRRQLVAVAIQLKVASGPFVPATSAPAPVDQRQKRVVEAAASEDEDTCSGPVFKRKQKADAAVPTTSGSDDRALGVRMYGLKREGGGVNCLRGIFANFEGIMKINAELQRKESRKQIPKTVLR